jgi:hypothetical protein
MARKNNFTEDDVMEEIKNYRKTEGKESYEWTG